MPKQVLTRSRSWTARIAVLAVVFSLLAVAVPASAHSVAIDTAISCPSTTPNAGFTDIGAFGADVQLAINCLAAFGISTGTTATTYNPNGTVLRWQMALFLIRQAADHGVTVPAAASQGFTDIGGLPQATQDAINQISQLGISKGTTTTTFSPNDAVTRWQMALFLRRLAGAAGVTVTDDPTHNQFGDIGAYSAEIQAAINFLADGHIALGVGASVFDGNSSVLRWQMALFLTRVLAADGVVGQQLLVTVTPTDAVSLAVGNARAYTATFKNANGTAYTGAVGIGLFAVTSGVIQYDGAPAAGAVFESQSDGLAVFGGNLYPTIEGFPGSDGVVTFLVRDTVGATETVVPVAWEDVNNDNDAEISGNTKPTEANGVGGNVTFAAGPAGECADNVASTQTVTAVDKAADRFEVSGLAPNPCSVFYDANDVFLVSTVASTLADFETALNVGDVVTLSPYRNTAGDQSTIDISTDNDPALTIVSPAAGGVTVDAATFSITGTAVPGYTVRIYDDQVPHDGVSDGTVAGTTTVAADGTWTVVVNLSQNQGNNFLAAQRPTPGGTDGPLVDVPTITDGTSAGATIEASGLYGGSGNGVLDAGDFVFIEFTEPVVGVGSGDTITFTDADGTTGTLTIGTNAVIDIQYDGGAGANSGLGLQITAALGVVGGSGGVNSPATIATISGFTDDDAEAINVVGSGAARSFTH